MAEAIELSPEMQEKLKKFNPNMPLVINTAEIAGLEDYVGRFVFRRPTNADRIKIAIKVAKLTEGVEIAGFAETLAHIIATFETVCTEKPEGIDFNEMTDAAPLFEIFEQFVQWQELFRLKLQADKKGTSPTK